MKDARLRIQELVEHASQLPYGRVQVALFEEAVQIADSLNDVELSFELRNDLMHSAVFSGRPEVMLVAFTWCLGRFDRDPERFDSDSFLFKYKWVVEYSLKFPQIDRPRIEALLADMRRRYQAKGWSMYAVEQLRRTFYVAFGENELAREAHNDFRKCRRDYVSDCEACVAHHTFEYHCSQRHWARAVRAAQSVLDGHLACVEQPHLTLAAVLLPLIRLGKFDEAKQYHRSGYRLVRSEQFLPQQAQHFQFVTLMGDFTAAKRLLERHLPAAIETVLKEECFQFLLAARIWTDRLNQRGTQFVRVRLPKALLDLQVDGRADVKKLAQWFTVQAKKIAAAYDARNGTNKFSEKIDELPEIVALAVD